MKVAFLIRGIAPFGGMQRRYARLASYLSSNKLKGNVQLVVSKAALADIKTIVGDNNDLPVATFGSVDSSTLSHKIKNAWSAINAIRNIEAEVVFLCSPPGLFPALVAMLLPTRRKICLCMVDYTIRQDASLFRRWTGSISCFFADRIDCLSPALAKDVKFLFGENARKKVRIAPCSFTDFSKIEYSTRRDIDVLMMARFMPEKGFDLLSEIAPFLKDINIHICGFGSYHFNKYQFKVYESVNPFNQMSRALIFLSLQKTNNYPSQSILEAMASGCGIIATDVGETRLLLDEDCAVLIPYNALALKEAIMELLSDRDRILRLGNNAREKVRKYHTLPRYERYFVANILS